MKVVRDSEDRVDLDAPVDMTEEQKEEFISFFEDNFDDVQVKEVKEPDREGGGGSSDHKKWTVRDRMVLLETNSNKAAADRLGRSKMSVRMKRGSFQPEFLQWAKEQGYAKPMENLREDMIEEFLEEER